MFRVVLGSVWKWSRWPVVLGTIAGFAIPVLSVQGASSADRNPLPPDLLLHSLQSWGVLYPVLAAALGLVVAICVWAPDNRGRHVHALSLPVARWRYVALRYGAGLTVLVLPMAVLLIGAIVATATSTVPPGLQSYPLSLGLRFALAVIVGYSVFFAVSSATTRTAGIILLVGAALVVIQIVARAAGIGLDLPFLLQNTVFSWPGPLAIFTGHWLLIDV